MRHSGRSGTGQHVLLLDYFCEFAQLFIFIRKAEVNINVLLVVKDNLLDELIHRIPVQFLNISVFLEEGYKFIVLLSGFF